MNNIIEYINADRTYYIYGTSNFGSYCYITIKQQIGDGCIGGFIETIPHAATFRKKPLISPHELDMKDERIYVIISSFTYINEMKQNLTDNGFSKDRILFFPEYKPFFRTLWEKEEDSLRSICFWPPVIADTEREFLLEKIEWYTADETMVIMYGNEPHHSLIPKNVRFHNEQERTEDMIKSDKIYLWDKSRFQDVKGFDEKVYLVDRHFFYTIEPANYQFLYHYSLSKEQKAETRRRSVQSFMKMKRESVSCKSANIFASGPSLLEDVNSLCEYAKQGFNIVVNTAITGKELTKNIDISCLVAADFSIWAPFKYRQEFYDSLVSEWRKSHFWIIVFEHQKAMIDARLPELQGYTIGMPFKYYTKGFVFPDENQFMVSATLNIITELAIPIASSICNDVNFFGCTGRKNTVDPRWEHFNESNTTEKRPIDDFFYASSRDYDGSNDYEIHCNTFESILRFGEEEGKTYNNMTTSYIPALKDRSKLE